LGGWMLIQEGKNLLTKIGKSKEMRVLKYRYWMFSFLIAEGLSWSLDVLFSQKSKIKKIAMSDQKN
jgi:hypothetical protein